MPLFYHFSEAFVGSPSFVHAHNLYLQIGLDTGLPGLIAWLAIVLNILVLLISAVSYPRHKSAWPLAAGTLGGIVAMLIHGLLDAVTWGTKLAFYPWILFALAVLVGLPRETDQNQANP